MRGLLVAIIVLATWPARADERPTYDQIVRMFEAISFSAEYGGEQRRGKFDRWEKIPIFVHLSGVDREMQVAIESTLADLASISGLIMRIALPSDAPNVFLAVIPSGDCSVQVRQQRTDITIAWDRWRRCVPEELAQLIGPGNDACEYRPSIFCGQDKNVPAMTWADRVIMKTTFDRRIANGAPKAEAMPLARQIIRELYDAGR